MIVLKDTCAVQLKCSRPNIYRPTIVVRSSFYKSSHETAKRFYKNSHIQIEISLRLTVFWIWSLDAPRKHRILDEKDTANVETDRSTRKKRRGKKLVPFEFS